MHIDFLLVTAVIILVKGMCTRLHLQRFATFNMKMNDFSGRQYMAIYMLRAARDLHLPAPCHIVQTINISSIFAF
jgi:hypothetical protein